MVIARASGCGGSKTSGRRGVMIDWISIGTFSSRTTIAIMLFLRKIDEFASFVNFFFVVQLLRL